MEVPIERVKFVCHDKHDTNTFAAIIQLASADIADPVLNHKLYCFQAETKIVSCIKWLELLNG